MLRATLLGGFAGTAVGIVISLIYHGMPLAAALIILAANRAPEDERAVFQQYVLVAALSGLVIASAGFAIGSLLMAVSSILLRASPRLLRVSALGATFGAIAFPCAVFIGATVPAIIERGMKAPDMPATFMNHWLLSLAAAICGSILGLLGLLVIGALQSRN